MRFVSQHMLSLCTLSALIGIIPVWGQEAQRDKCAHLDPTKPIICLYVPNDKLTITRRGGEMAIYASLVASAAVTKPVRITIATHPPNNPSGVKLDEGTGGASANFDIDAAHPIQDQLLLDVRTSKDNPTSGRLVFGILVRSEAAVELRGSPVYILMETNPD